MKFLIAIFVLFILPVTAHEQASTKQTIELTRDNPATLISTNSFGLHHPWSQARNVADSSTKGSTSEQEAGR
jgi:hypothetical protein